MAALFTSQLKLKKTKNANIIFIINIIQDILEDLRNTSNCKNHILQNTTMLTNINIIVPKLLIMY